MDSGIEILNTFMLEVVVDGKEIMAPGILTADIPYSKASLDDCCWSISTAILCMFLSAKQQ